MSSYDIIYCCFLVISYIYCYLFALFTLLSSSPFGLGKDIQKGTGRQKHHESGPRQYKLGPIQAFASSSLVSLHDNVWFHQFINEIKGFIGT